MNLHEISKKLEILIRFAPVVASGRIKSLVPRASSQHPAVQPLRRRPNPVRMQIWIKSKAKYRVQLIGNFFQSSRRCVDKITDARKMLLAFAQRSFAA